MSSRDLISCFILQLNWSIARRVPVILRWNMACCASLWAVVLAEVSADGTRQMPPLGNLSNWAAVGPAAIYAARTGIGAESVGKDMDTSVNGDDPRSLSQADASDDPSGLVVPHDVEAAMELVQKIGYLPGTLGEHVARMRTETESPSAEVRRAAISSTVGMLILPTYVIFDSCLFSVGHTTTNNHTYPVSVSSSVSLSLSHVVFLASLTIS